MEKSLILLLIAGLVSFFFGVMMRSVFQKPNNNGKNSNQINEIEKTCLYIKDILPVNIQNLDVNITREISSINTHLIDVKNILRDNGLYMQNLINKIK